MVYTSWWDGRGKEGVIEHIYPNGILSIILPRVFTPITAHPMQCRWIETQDHSEPTQ